MNADRMRQVAYLLDLESTVRRLRMTLEAPNTAPVMFGGLDLSIDYDWGEGVDDGCGMRVRPDAPECIMLTIRGDLRVTFRNRDVETFQAVSA